MSKQFTQVALVALGAIVLYDQARIVRKDILLNKSSVILQDAQDIMSKDSETINYLLDILNKHRPQIDEFDVIALSNLGINFGEEEPR